LAYQGAGWLAQALLKLGPQFAGGSWQSRKRGKLKKRAELGSAGSAWNVNFNNGNSNWNEVNNNNFVRCVR
jgi:hypothetical protein